MYVDYSRLTVDIYQNMYSYAWFVIKYACPATQQKIKLLSVSRKHFKKSVCDIFNFLQSGQKPDSTESVQKLDGISIKLEDHETFLHLND